LWINVFSVWHTSIKSPIDPEGLLGVIPSIAHTLIGFWIGKTLMEHQGLKDKMLHLFLIGFALLAIGLLFTYGLPFNKRIWSPTFVLFTCGAASCLQAWLIHDIDDKGYRKWTPFFESFGINPLFLYVFSELHSIRKEYTSSYNEPYSPFAVSPMHTTNLPCPCMHSLMFMHAFFDLQTCIFIFYGRKKAFLRLWHDSFTVVEKHFHNCKNKFCCLRDERMQALCQWFASM
jgi:hypothetical protein